jgi:hypothetical protein
MKLARKRPFIRRDERSFRGTTPIFRLSIETVDLRGLEPLTSSMPWRRSPNCATGPCTLVQYLTHTLKDGIHECSQLSIYSSLYAITGIPTSAQRLEVLLAHLLFSQRDPFYQICQDTFTLVARRRVRSSIAASQHPATLCYCTLTSGQK